MNKKLGMSNFQLGILFFLGIITCAIVGGVMFLVFSRTSDTKTFNIIPSNPSGQIVGKWEVVSGAGIGTIYEFFPDGTVSTSAFVAIASKYSYPDQAHIKIEAGNFAVVYEYVLSNDKLSLISGSSTLALVKYVELPLDMQVVVGVWKRSRPDDSECFKKLEIDTPQDVSLGADGSFMLHGGVDNYMYPNFIMNGTYAVNGNNLHIAASGTQESPLQVMIPMPAVGMPGIREMPTATPIPPIQKQGEFSCVVTVSNSRLSFIDSLNKVTLFVRTGN